jgi:hypothetical protein
VNVVCYASDIQTDVNVTIQVADGSYAEEINLYNFIGSLGLDPNGFSAPVLIQGNVTNPSNVVLTGLSNPVNESIFSAYSVSSPWKITGFTIAPIGASDGFDIWNSHDVTLGVINSGQCAVRNFGFCIYLSMAQCSLRGGNITISGSGWELFATVGGNSFLDMGFVASFDITTSVSFSSVFMDCVQQSAVVCAGTTINLNGNSVSGKRFNLKYGGKIYGVGQNLSYFPGNAPGTYDDTADYDGIKFCGAQQISGLPTTSNLSAGFAGVFKDTTGGGVYLAYNDNGVIKSVALS